MRVHAVVHFRAPDHSLDLCVPYAPSFGIRQHDEIDKAHDLLGHKALYHGDEHRRRQVEEVELRQLSDASGPHGDYL